jgi:CBS-domain-containing membrane protein
MNENATDRLRSLRVADAMAAKAYSVDASHTLAEAARIFAEHHITWAPVVEEGGRCVGVFSVADLLKRTEAAGLRFDSEEPVSAYMTSKVYTTTAEAPLLEAAAMMSDRHVHRLPVLDRQQRLKGVLSTMDVVAALLHAVEEVDSSLLAELQRERKTTET